MTGYLRWMYDICRADALPPSIMARPWSFVRNGETWNAATNGHIIVAVKGLNAFGGIEPDREKPALALLARDRPPASVGFNDLAAFAGKPQYRLCQACHGTGDKVCCKCERPFDGVECGACNGTKREAIRSTVRVASVLIDKSYLARALEHLRTGKEVYIGEVSKSELHIRCDDWHVIIMATLNRMVDEDGEAPSFPKKETT